MEFSESEKNLEELWYFLDGLCFLTVADFCSARKTLYMTADMITRSERFSKL